MHDKFISQDRKMYLRKIRINKFAILITQIAIIISFIVLWEVLANLKVIDSFITSQPSRIINTFMNLSSNDLLHHLGVTFYETIVRISFTEQLLVFVLQQFCGFQNFYQKLRSHF